MLNALIFQSNDSGKVMIPTDKVQYISNSSILLHASIVSTDLVNFYLSAEALDNLINRGLPDHWIKLVGSANSSDDSALSIQDPFLYLNPAHIAYVEFNAAPGSYFIRLTRGNLKLTEAQFNCFGELASLFKQSLDLND